MRSASTQGNAIMLRQNVNGTVRFPPTTIAVTSSVPVENREWIYWNGYTEVMTMSRYIDADKIEYHEDDAVYRHEINAMPTADVRENRKGDWRISHVPSKDEIKIVYCSNCEWGKMIEEEREYNFCPNCGADMRKGAE